VSSLFVAVGGGQRRGRAAIGASSACPRCARVPCDARHCGFVAQLAAFTSFTPLKQSPRVSSRSALRAQPQYLRFWFRLTFASQMRPYTATSLSAAHRRAAVRPPTPLRTRWCCSTKRAKPVSSATHPQAEHRSGVGAQRRPHQRERLTGTASRDTYHSPKKAVQGH